MEDFTLRQRKQGNSNSAENVGLGIRKTAAAGPTQTTSKASEGPLM